MCGNGCSVIEKFQCNGAEFKCKLAASDRKITIVMCMPSVSFLVLTYCGLASGTLPLILSFVPTTNCYIYLL